MSQAQKFIVEWPGQRLDQFLAQKLPDHSRAAVKIIFDKGEVLLDGLPAKADRRLKGGERVEVQFPEASWGKQSNFEDWVIYEDSHLLALNKPSGLLMHPMSPAWLKDPKAALLGAEPNLAGLLELHRPKIISSKVPRCGIVHRLDRQTSGVLLAAKTQEAYKALLAIFKERRLKKVYRAIVRGKMQDPAPSVVAPVGRLAGERRIAVTQFGRQSQTAFVALVTCACATLVEARPLTGRTHQIRAHLAFLGHPVAGDVDFDRQKAKLRPDRMLLHAYSLQLEHPINGRPMSFQALPPKDFAKFWALCRKEGK